MKKLLLGTILLTLAIVVPIPTMAGVNISIGISLPPPIVFEAPPDVIVIPDTNNVYVVPNIRVDLFFWNGWWWRPWGGRWYRSPYYERGWEYYGKVPSFYFDVDPSWRRHYRNHNWYGHRWYYERIPSRQVEQNWKRWENNRYWERQRTWGVKNYKPRTQSQREELRHQRQVQYQRRLEVKRHQKQMHQQQRQRQVGQPERQHQQPQQERQRKVQQAQSQQQPKQQKTQPLGKQHQGKSRLQHPQEKPDREDEGQRR